ncbi:MULTISPECIES: PH domain-containing protein [Kitasatospora]|uniref:PH domain-containing protein n=1 Tax=Kitasatospora TaxID=2063 RepID=UPI0004C3BA2B|nr:MULTISPECIES: PH domain-containing protein [unclassified Kitasatospora]WAL70604.1 PH domain-containing protein [Kitasatospora sp. YST-16]WNW36645.1 PH domain-containing protein [Streptomyces sp. Li-HN-5-13]
MSTATPVALPVTWAPRRNRAVLYALCAVMLVLFSVLAVVLPESWQFNDRVMMACSGVLFAAVGLMLARPKVVADPEGLTVVNFVRSRRLSWAEVVRVNFKAGDPWVMLDLADGTALAAVGIQPGGGRAQAIAAARSLRDLVEQRGSGARQG